MTQCWPQITCVVQCFKQVDSTRDLHNTKVHNHNLWKNNPRYVFTEKKELLLLVTSFLHKVWDLLPCILIRISDLYPMTLFATVLTYPKHVDEVTDSNQYARQ